MKSIRATVVIRLTQVIPPVNYDQAGYEAAVQEVLDEAVEDLLSHARDIRAMECMELRTRVHRLAQADDDALWETVGREG